MSEKIEIYTYQSKYQAQVIELILKIQQDEFGLPITLDEQPDLLNIPTVYQQGKGNFWVALDGEKVIGTIAGIDIGNSQLALRNMFVNVNYRGNFSSTSKQLMNSLLNWARDKDVQEIYLETVEQFKAAHRFYEKNGFIRVSKFDLPANFPVMPGDNIFYKLSLCTKPNKTITARKRKYAQ